MNMITRDELIENANRAKALGNDGEIDYRGIQYAYDRNKLILIGYDKEIFPDNEVPTEFWNLFDSLRC